MSHFHTFITLIVTTLVVLTSIVQYHHHDSDGAICMYISEAHIMHEEQESSGNSCKHHDKDDSDCGAKLSNVNATKKISITDINLLVRNIGIIYSNLFELHENEIQTLIFAYNQPKFKFISPHVYGLRAPPFA